MIQTCIRRLGCWCLWRHERAPGFDIIVRSEYSFDLAVGCQTSETCGKNLKQSCHLFGNVNKKGKNGFKKKPLDQTTPCGAIGPFTSQPFGHNFPL